MRGASRHGLPQAGNGLQRLLLALPDGVLLLDGAGSVRYANPAAERLFGYEQGSMAGHPLGCPVLEGRAEVEIPRQGEGMAVAEIRAVELEWDGERLTLATFRDITGRKLAEEKTATLGRELLEVYETLQDRLGKEIHDAIGQPLVGLKLALQRYRDLQEQDREIGLGEVGLLIDDMVDVVRELSHALRPTTGKGWSL
ncbi:MAG: PAS domain S-box protein, partial [Spirochaetales bacterium]|nr:PAS domain S-box protein [Spirochaetales bacterium]